MFLYSSILFKILSLCLSLYMCVCNTVTGSTVPSGLPACRPCGSLDFGPEVARLTSASQTKVIYKQFETFADITQSTLKINQILTYLIRSS